MSIQRQQNWLGQQRGDIPHFRSLDSSVAADFDALAGTVLAGNQALIVKGFDILMNGAIGNIATALVLRVAGGALIHPLASEAGSVFVLADDAAAETLSSVNSRIDGSFTSGTINYLGIDLARSADDTTTDTVMFIDPVTNLETPRAVPLARTIDFRIVISTQDFSTTPNVAPIAKITLDNGGNVTAIEDARQMYFRLGAGGTNVDPVSSFAWPDGRAEGAVSDLTAFTGGDKTISSDKAWRDAVMTRLWEVGGGEHWFTAATDRDVKVGYGQPDTFSFDVGLETLTWANLKIVFANSETTSIADPGVYYNEIADGDEVIEDGQCLYVDIDRSQNLTGGSALVMQVGDLNTLGSSTIPGSRYIIAWRVGDEVFGRDRSFSAEFTIAVATTSSSGTVKLAYAAGTPSDPKVYPLDANGRVNASATGGNSEALNGTGNGTGPGVKGTGGSTDGTGVRGIGGGTNGNGVTGTAVGTGSGVHGTGGSSNGVGVEGHGQGTGAGVSGTGGGTNGVGGSFAGVGSGQGVYGVGGATAGSVGAYGTSSATNGNGVRGDGTGTGTGVDGYSGNTAGSIGVRGTANSASGGAGVQGLGGTGTSAGVIGQGGSTAGSIGIRAIAGGSSAIALTAELTDGSTLDPDTRAAAIFSNPSTSNGTTIPMYFLHAGADGGRDGVALWTDRLAEDIVRFNIGGVTDSGAVDSWLEIRGDDHTVLPGSSSNWRIGDGPSETFLSVNAEDVRGWGVATLANSDLDLLSHNQQNSTVVRCSFKVGSPPTAVSTGGAGGISSGGVASTNHWNVNNVARNGGVGRYRITLDEAVDPNASVNIQVGLVTGGTFLQTRWNTLYQWDSVLHLDVFIIRGDDGSFNEEADMIISVTVVGTGNNLQ